MFCHSEGVGEPGKEAIDYMFPLCFAVSPTEDETKSAVFKYQNRESIKGKFAKFQRKVCSKLLKSEVDINEFWLFVITLFSPGDCIPPPPTDFTKVFAAITRHGLWSYFHFSPLAEIIHEFCASDPEMETLIQQYEKDLKSYTLVTTIEDCIEPMLDSDADQELDADTDPPPAKRAKYDSRYLCPMEWKTDFVEHSLTYVTDVWKMFSAHYLVPKSPPTALLDRVRSGCVTITWLVPSGLIPQLVKTAKVDTDFFQKHRILKVTVGDQCVYEEETSKDSTSVSNNKSYYISMG